MSIMVDDLLDTGTAARHVGCSIGTIRYRMARGGLVPAARLGQMPFFTVAQLDAYFGEKPICEDRRRRP